MSQQKIWTKVEGMELPDLNDCCLVQDSKGLRHILGGAMQGTKETHNHFIFDFESKQFFKKAAIPLENYQGCHGISIGNKIYLGGGNSNFNPTNKFFSYNIDTDTWTALADIPVAGYCYSFGAVDDRIYVCGGGHVDGLKFHNTFNSLFCYDIKTNTWEKKADMLYASFSTHQMPDYKGALYFFGGGSAVDNQFNNFDSCQKYVIAEDKWYPFSAPPKTSLFPGNTIYGDKVYLVGGCCGAPGATRYSYINSVYEYSLKEDSWTELENFPIPILLGNLTIYQNKLYHIGGGGLSAAERKRDVYSYDLASSTKLKIVLEQGKTVQLNGLLLPQGVTVEDVDWSTEDVGIATVDTTGLVTAVDAGIVRIIVEAKDKSWSDSVLVKVEEAPEYRLSIFLKEGETCQLTIDEVGTWTSSDPTVVAVSEDGLVTAVAEGVTQITVSTTGDEKSENIYVKVEKIS